MSKSKISDMPDKTLLGNIRIFKKFILKWTDVTAIETAKRCVQVWQEELARRGVNYNDNI